MYSTRSTKNAENVHIRIVSLFRNSIKAESVYFLATITVKQLINPIDRMPNTNGNGNEHYHQHNHHGRSYKVGEKIESTSGPCINCTCGGDGKMKCDPQACVPEPTMQQVMAVVATGRKR